MKIHVADALLALEEIAPSRWAYSWDRIGLQVGSPDATVSKGVVCLDLTHEIASSLPAHALVVTHHPLIWDPMKTVRTDTAMGRTLATLLEKKASLITAHTNWDAAPNGVNDTLARRLGLIDVRCFGSAQPTEQLKVVVHCPSGSEDRLLDAISAAGAGVIGAYRRCAFLSQGVGTYIGSEDSNPVVGQRGQVERVEEVRVEAVAPADAAEAVEAAIRAAHPYEEPAFDFFTLRQDRGQQFGRLGDLLMVYSLFDFRELVDEKLGTRSQVSGGPDRAIRHVAVVGGSAAGEWQEAKRAGADVLVTGEARHSHLIEAGHSGFPIVIAGHYATEHPGMETLTSMLSERLPQVAWEVATQDAGSYGATW